MIRGINFRPNDMRRTMRAENRLIRAQMGAMTATYAYDPMGRRAQKARRGRPDAPLPSKSQ